MNGKNTDEFLVEKIHAQLDASLDNIDAPTQSKITRARYRALEQKNTGFRLPGWVPLGAVATACVAVLVVSLMPEPAIDTSIPVEDLELISNIDDLELLEELEFYEWLEDYELPT